jgi:hypothetical protein
MKQEELFKIAFGLPAPWFVGRVEFVSQILLQAGFSLTSVFAERVNLKVKEIKHTAKGYPNLNNYIAVIYFHCGGLDLPA